MAFLGCTYLGINMDKSHVSHLSQIEKDAHFWKYESSACIDACRHQPPTVQPWCRSMQANILCQYCIYRASGEDFSAFLLQLRKDAQAFKLWIYWAIWDVNLQYLWLQPKWKLLQWPCQGGFWVTNFWGMHLRNSAYCQCSGTATNIN